MKLTNFIAPFCFYNVQTAGMQIIFSMKEQHMKEKIIKLCLLAIEVQQPPAVQTTETQEDCKKICAQTYEEASREIVNNLSIPSCDLSLALAGHNTILNILVDCHKLCSTNLN